jgi:hypothetical protein
MQESAAGSVKIRPKSGKAKKNAAEAALKDLETSFDEGVTSRKWKHSRDAAIDSVQNPQLTV